MDVGQRRYQSISRTIELATSEVPLNKRLQISLAVDIGFEQHAFPGVGRHPDVGIEHVRFIWIDLIGNQDVDAASAINFA